MEKIKYIFVIEAEQDFNTLIRILTSVARNRILVQEMHTGFHENVNLQICTLTLSETKENAARLSQRINKEIDVHSVKIFEQLN